MTRHLLIKAKGGLGNRMLAAIGGLVYADLSGRTPVIDWRDGEYAPKGVDAYPLLFMSPQTVDPASLENVDDVVPAVWRGALHKSPIDLIAAGDPREHQNPRAYRRSCVDLARIDAETPLAVYWSHLPKFGRMRGVMRRDPRYRGKSQATLFRAHLDAWFTPKPHVLAAVDALLPPERRPAIGVHIRYTDRKTPVTAFERAVAAALAETPAASVFLATDSAAIETRFRETFPRVFTAPKWLPPDGARLHGNKAAPDMVREAENALIDMWALSRCDRLIYSSFSTFSYTSFLLSGRDADFAVDIERWNPVIQAKRVLQDYL